ncbi:MAG: Gfo/Idh/MocA family oxidoreductase [Phycisphaerae bacterium]|nr:Gfo/Idh/MocA family oxidoreductase [Phycisphaerae bacterium]
MAKAKAKVRIGFVGVGGMGQAAHLRNYVNVDECEVVALAEIKPELGKLVAQRFGIARVYKDHKEMLAVEKLDAIVASQMFDRHALLFPELYGKAKFLFSEKPIAVTPKAGKMLADLAAKTGTTHMVGYHKRSDPATMYAKSVIDKWKASGEFGKMKYVRISMPAGDWVANGFTGLLRTAEQIPATPGEVGDNVWHAPKVAGMSDEMARQFIGFVNYYIHQVNLMRHLLGESYEVAYAEETNVMLAVRGASGTAGVIEMTPYQTSTAWEESALIAFEKGYVKLDLPAPLAVNRAGTVEIYKDNGKGTPERVSPTLPWIHAMRQQAINFVKVCQGKMNPLCDAAEAYEDLLVARQFIKVRYGK